MTRNGVRAGVSAQAGRPLARLGLYLRLVLLLDLLFLVVYGGLNWLTARRSDVHALYFDWERHVPFVPGMIVAYFSIVILFVLPLFLLDERAMRLLARRIALAILLSGSVYLLLPAKLGFERTQEVPGYAPIFRVLHALDAPHNLVPSLHIGYSALIVAALIGVGLPVWAEVFLCAWLGLIAVAVVLVHQHHLADVAGGFAVAWISWRCSKAIAGTDACAPGGPMKTSAAVVLAVVLGGVTASAQEREADHAQLREMRHMVETAVNENKLDVLLPLLDDDFALTMLDQTLITRPAELKSYFERHFEAPGAVLKSVHIQPEADILTRFLDENTGVNRGTSTDTYTLRNGSQVVLHTRWSGTFRKVDGRWKIVGLHVGANVLDNPILSFAQHGRHLWGAGGVALGALMGFLLGRRRAARPA